MGVNSVSTFLGGGSGGLKGIVNFPVCKYQFEWGLIEYSVNNYPVSLDLPNINNVARDFSSTGNFVIGKEFSYNEINCRNFTINSGHQLTVDGLNVIKAAQNITIGGNGVIGVNRGERGVFLDMPYDHANNTSGFSGTKKVPVGKSGGGHGSGATFGTSPDGLLIESRPLLASTGSMNKLREYPSTRFSLATGRGGSALQGFGGGQPQVTPIPFGAGAYTYNLFINRTFQTEDTFNSLAQTTTGGGGGAGGFSSNGNNISSPAQAGLGALSGGTCTGAIVLIADSIDIAANITMTGGNGQDGALNDAVGGGGGGHGGYVFLFANTINFNGGTIDVSGGNGGSGSDNNPVSNHSGGGGGGGHSGLIYAQASTFLTNTTTKTGNVGTGGASFFSTNGTTASAGSDGGYVEPWGTHYVQVEGRPF